MRIALIRQQPSIGDALLLSPLIREIKAAHPRSHLTVITDPMYLGGALPKIFAGLPGVNRVDQVSGFEWRPDLPQEVPYSVRSADLVLNCNTAFLDFEGAHGGAPPCGIAEFWLRHFDRWREGVDMRPAFNVSEAQKRLVEAWLGERGIFETGKLVGVVMQSGAPARDWDFHGMSARVCDWLHCAGYKPITIDLTKQSESIYAIPCVGQQIDFIAALLSYCTAVVTPDTGLLHLAEAVGTKTVAIWGIMDPRLRLLNYNTTLVPDRSLGYCTGSEERSCQCWKLQRWSCLRRVLLSHIVNGMEAALNDR